MARNAPSFLTLDKAFWLYVDQYCPHPIQSRQRYAWVRANLTFDYGGVVYRRQTVTVPAGPSGRQVTAIVYIAEDGSKIQSQHLPQSFYGAA